MEYRWLKQEWSRKLNGSNRGRLKLAEERWLLVWKQSLTLIPLNMNRLGWLLCAGTIRSFMS